MSKRTVPPSKALTRRQFIYSSAMAAGATALAGCATAAPRTIGQSDKLNIAVVGLAGKGSDDMAMCSGENIIALCDADSKVGAGAREKHPKAAFYRDFRVMLEKEKAIDAVIVATPDHLHANVAAMAIKLGKHVYCQKPLVRTIYEARLLRKLAAEHKVATQMGNQGSAEDGLRRAVEVVQAGLLGPVREVYVWSNRPIWPQGMERPPGSDPIPPTLNWDLWIGPAPMRPYKASWPGATEKNAKPVYHPFAWRGWQDFGTGALGDMACHTANMPFRALKLGYPTEIEAESSPMNKESWPLKSKIRFQFPARENLAPVTFRWYDGGNPLPDNPYRHDGNNKPPSDVIKDVEELLDKVPGSGCLLVGDNGKLFSPDDYGAKFFVKLKGDKEMVDGRNHDAVKAIPQTIPRNAHQGDADPRHHLEWIAACKGGRPGYSSFEYATLLTETILLGCVALRVGRKIEWDGPAMRATNAPEAEQYIKPVARKGWEL